MPPFGFPDKSHGRCSSWLIGAGPNATLFDVPGQGSRAIFLVVLISTDATRMRPAARCGITHCGIRPRPLYAGTHRRARETLSEC